MKLDDFLIQLVKYCNCLLENRNRMAEVDLLGSFAYIPELSGLWIYLEDYISDLSNRAWLLQVYRKKGRNNSFTVRTGAPSSWRCLGTSLPHKTLKTRFLAVICSGSNLSWKGLSRCLNLILWSWVWVIEKRKHKNLSTFSSNKGYILDFSELINNSCTRHILFF